MVALTIAESDQLKIRPGGQFTLSRAVSLYHSGFTTAELAVVPRASEHRTTEGS